MENRGKTINNYDNLRETEEGIEVKIFLQTLKRIYHVNESVGTYVCSKMKNFMNNYRHKTKRLIFEGLCANKIISTKVNDIIDTALKESNFEKVFESLADLYYCSEFNKNLGIPAVCKVQPQKNELSAVSCTDESSSSSQTTSAGQDTDNNAQDSSVCESVKTEIIQRTKRVLVENENQVKVINLKEFNTISSLKANLIEALNVKKGAFKYADIKHFSKSLKKWVNLKSWKLLKNDEMLKIFFRKVKSQNEPQMLENENMMTIEPQDPPPLLYHNNQDIEATIPLEQQIEEVIKEYKKSGGEKPWILSFKLPVFENKFAAQMEKGEITSKDRMKICHTIQEYVAHYDKNPSPEEIAIIIKMLFLTYPKLAEVYQDSWVTWNIWKVSLNDAFSKGRKSESSSETATPNGSPAKTKGGTKRKFRSPDASSTEPKKKNSDSTPSQNEELSASIEPGGIPMEVVPTSEASRTVAPMERLSPAMDATFDERRRQVVDEGWSIQDILISYPWLHNENEIFAEFSRIVDLDDTVDKAIDLGFRKIVYALLHSLRSHAKYRTILEKEKELRKDTDRKGGLKDFEYKMALFALPFAFGEDIEDIFKQEGSVYEEPIQIEFSGGNRYEDAKSFAVIIEDAKVECSSLKKAVAVFVAAFFIFNLTYPSDIKKFLYFIERNLLGIPGKAAPPSQVTKLVKKIDDYLDGKEEE